MKNFLDWNTSIDLIQRLLDDKKYKIALLIILTIYTGCKINKIRNLRWISVLNRSEIYNNGITISLPEDFHTLIEYCYKSLGEPSKNSIILISQKGVPFSVQRLNVLLKEVNNDYDLKIIDLTTNTLRKTFGRRILENSESFYQTLRSLQIYFQHSTISFTIDYLNIDKMPEKIQNVISVGDENYFDEFKNKGYQNLNNKTNSGYVYIIKDENYPDTYKIGKSKNPKYREKTLYHQSPYISLFKVVHCEKPSELEHEIHLRLHNKRIRGEWFKLSEFELNNIIKDYGFIDIKYEHNN